MILGAEIKAATFVCQAPVVEARVRLFCLPFAGGTAAVFHGWGERLRPEVEVWAAQPRARGMRFRERPLGSVAEMAEEYLEALRVGFGLGGPAAGAYAFYGHSLGGLLAFELVRRIEAEGLPGPQHLFIGATVPPHMGLIHERIGHLEDGAFVDAVQERYGGIPAEMLREPELLALFLPALKTDFAAYENHVHRRGKKIAAPMTVFAGEGDTASRAVLLEEWERYTSGPFMLRVTPGDHFFLSRSLEMVLGWIRQGLGVGGVGESE